MIQTSKILSELYGVGKSVVGFRQPINPLYSVLNAVNITSTSGIYLEGGMVTIENIKSCQDKQQISSTDLNSVIERLIKDSIIDACTLVFNESDKLGSGLLFNKENKITETLDNNGDFVGFEIKVISLQNITSIINNLICEFDAVGSLTVYLFHSSQQTAIKSQAVTLTENNSIKTYVNWILDAHKEYGGKFLLGYLTNGLTPKAINREWDSSRQKEFKNISIRPIIISGHTSTSLPNIDNIIYTSDTYGINLDLSIFNDYTDFIIDNKNKIANLIKYQFQANVLKMIAFSNRSNGIEENAKMVALKELEGILTESGNIYSQGILRKLENEAKKIKDTFFKRDSITVTTLT